MAVLIPELKIKRLERILGGIERESMEQPAKVKHVIWLLPQDTSQEELEETTRRLHPTRSAFTYSADAAHAVVAAGTAESRVNVIDPYRWARGQVAGQGDIYEWMYQRGIPYKVFFMEQLQECDGFHAPVGTQQERDSGEYPPGNWIDANPYGNYYENPSTGNSSYHTGSDLNLNVPYWDADRGADVYAAADGVVSYAFAKPVWGNILVVRHNYRGEELFTRYAHLDTMDVRAGDFVSRGQKIGTIGRDALGGPAHLHFDIGKPGSTVMGEKPWDWPGNDLGFLFENYVDPRAFIPANLPDVPPPPPPPPAGYKYNGPNVIFTPAIHGPGSDWAWHGVGVQDFEGFMNRLNMPVKLMTNGVYPDFAHHSRGLDFARIFWQPQMKTVTRAWEEDMRDGVQKMLDRGITKFEILNEPNLTQEGLGLAWDDKVQFGWWLDYIAGKVKGLGGRAYFPGMSPGVPWTNQFVWTDYLWTQYSQLFDGFCLHAYTGETSDIEAAAQDIYTQVKETQSYLNLQVPMIVSESSVNRGSNYEFKARVYRRVESLLQGVPGIEAIVWFISWWDAPPAQEGHGESWFGTSLPDYYLSL